MLVVTALWQFSAVFPNQVYAADSCLGSRSIDFVAGTNQETTLVLGYEGQTVTFTLEGLPPNKPGIELWHGGPGKQLLTTADSNGDGVATFTFTIPDLGGTLPKLNLELHSLTGTPSTCTLWDKMVIHSNEELSCSGSGIKISQTRGGNQCFWNNANGCIETGKTISVSVSGVKEGGQPFTGTVQIKMQKASPQQQVINISSGSSTSPVVFTLTDTGSSVKVSVESNKIGSWLDICNRNIEIVAADSCGEACPTEQEDVSADLEAAKEDPYFLCDQLPQGSQAKQNCIRCATGGGGVENPGDDESRKGIWTAIGCIKREPQNIVASLIQVGLTMGGGIALLMILAAGFLISTSQGDPKKVSDAKELITAAITGLLFIIFSVVMLQFIGFSVFKLPGFGG